MGLLGFFYGAAAVLTPMRSVVAWTGGGPGHWTCPKEQRVGDILPLPEQFEEEKPALRL